MRLTGKTALVIGGTRGIGRAICERFAEEGAHTIVTGRDARAGREVVDHIVADGSAAQFVALDARDLAGLRGVIRVIAAERGVDVVVSNAAATVPKPLLETSEDEYEWLTELNIRAVFFAMKWAAETMIGRGGSIINICSTAATRGLPDRALYCATKAAVLQMTRAAALDVGVHGVRINCISPGAVDTEQLRASRFGQDPDPDAAVNQLGASIPLGRLGRTSDIAAAAVYFASDDSTWTTGANLVVDGGGYL